MAETNKLSVRQVGRNLITVIEKEKFTKKTETNDEVDFIRNKIELYNKKPSKARLEEIKTWFTPPKKQEAEKKKMVKKGLTKSIKKEKKKAPKKAKAVVEEAKTGDELVKEVENAYIAGTMSDEQIRSLQKLLAKEEAARAENKEKAEERSQQQQSSSSYNRSGREH